MAVITRTGKPPMNTFGDLPKAGQPAPAFTLTNTSMEEVTAETYKGKNIVLNIFPSADTPTCELSIKKFNEEATKIPNTVVLCVSMDLPFAHKRFCATNNTQNVISLSAFRSPKFGEQYGVLITDGYLRGLFARGVVVINPQGLVIHSELVKELTNQPDYESCLASLGKKTVDASSTATASAASAATTASAVVFSAIGGTNGGAGSNVPMADGPTAVARDKVKMVG